MKERRRWPSIHDCSPSSPAREDKGPLYYLGDADGLYNPRLHRRYVSATASR